METPSAPTEGPVRFSGVPNSLTTGATVLVASAGDPTDQAICLRLLETHARGDDTAFVVTTTESADRTLDANRELGDREARPSLRVVDTESQQQFVSSLYGETPVVFTPSPGDLERLVLALSELAENPTPGSTQHLLVRSLTPVLEETTTASVCSVLERVTGLRSKTGLCLLGIDYTAHGEETMSAVAEHVDGVLWVTEDAEGRVEFDYSPTRGVYTRSTTATDTGTDD